MMIQNAKHTYFLLTESSSDLHLCRFIEATIICWLEWKLQI